MSVDLGSERERVHRLPDARLAALWLALAHLSLVAALAVVARWPGVLAGSVWSPPLLAAVHLVTVGCITGTILGALPLVATMALRTRVPRHRGDLAAWASYAVALAGLVAGFWSGRYALVATAGLALIIVASWVIARVVRSLRATPVTARVLRHFPLALGGWTLGGVAGLVVALDRMHPLLPGAFLAKGFAHAHLMVLAFVLPVVFGAGFRLLPMLLPAAMPEGRAVGWSGPLAGLGGIAIAGGLLAGRAVLVGAGALLALGGVGCFVGAIAQMVRRLRPAPPARPRPDLPLLHAGASVLGLLAAAVCGIVLLARGGAGDGLRAAYGVLALLGCFVQLIVGVSQRLVGWLAWLLRYAQSGYAAVPPTPYALVPRALQAIVGACWLAGVPVLALAAGLAQPRLVRAGALLLLAGTAVNAFLLLRALWPTLRARPV